MPLSMNTLINQCPVNQALLLPKQESLQWCPCTLPLHSTPSMHAREMTPNIPSGLRASEEGPYKGKGGCGGRLKRSAVPFTVDVVVCSHTVFPARHQSET